MVKLVDKKEDKASSVIHINQNDDFDMNQPFGIERDYGKILEERIKEKKLSIETSEKEIKGIPREHLQKKRKWMGELLKAILGIKGIIDNTEIVEVNLIYRTRRVILNDLKNIVIKSIDYDESKIVKSGFKLDIDFFPRSQALNNKRDCYLVQILGDSIVEEKLIKYYNLDMLMEFIINYCSEYIAEYASKRAR